MTGIGLEVQLVSRGNLKHLHIQSLVTVEVLVKERVAHAEMLDNVIKLVCAHVEAKGSHVLKPLSN